MLIIATESRDGLSMVGGRLGTRALLLAIHAFPADAEPAITLVGDRCTHQLSGVCGPWTPELLAAVAAGHPSWQTLGIPRPAVVRTYLLDVVLTYMLQLVSAWGDVAPAKARILLETTPEPPPVDELEGYARFWACQCICAVCLRSGKTSDSA